MERFRSCIKLCLIKVCTPITLIEKLQVFVILLFFKAKMHIQRPREVRFRRRAKYMVDYIMSMNQRWFGQCRTSRDSKVAPYRPQLFQNYSCFPLQIFQCNGWCATSTAELVAASALNITASNTTFAMLSGPRWIFRQNYLTYPRIHLGYKTQDEYQTSR